jgi:hypothetical protein
MLKLNFRGFCIPSRVSGGVISGSAEKHTVYGSLFLLAVGGTLLWVSHMIQYRAIYKQLDLHFAEYPSAVADRVLAAASVPYVESFVAIFAFGLIFLALGFGGLVWVLHSTRHARSVFVHIIGIMFQIPQFIILHSSAANSNFPKTALTALIVGLSIGVLGIVLLVWSLSMANSEYIGGIPTVITKLFYVCGNILSTVSLVVLCGTSSPKIALNLFLVSYSLLIVSLVGALIVYERHRGEVNRRLLVN